MRKNKMYFFLSILTIIFLFSFAALCNQCGTATEEEKIAVGEEEAAAEEEEAVVEEAADGEEEDADGEEEAADEEEEEEAEEEEEEEKVAPTIELEIYQDATYSESDSVCYYRIKATVTGNPSPTVEFSKDDSLGAFGSKKAQVNLNDPAETYTLTATATNSEGTDTDSIDLSWGCNRPPEIAEITLMGNYYTEVDYTISVAASDPDGDPPYPMSGVLQVALLIIFMPIL